MELSLRKLALAALAVLLLGVGHAEARAGGGSSFGSRGTRTFSMPAPTQTAPQPAAPIQRSATQSGQAAPAAMAPTGGGFGLGRSLMWGLIGGGVIGLLAGNGMGSIFSLILQVALIALLIRLAMAFFGRRPAIAGGAPGYARSGLGGLGGRPGTMGGGPAPTAAAPVAVTAADYAAFERLLANVQDAYGREDVGTLRRLATPEMAAYFEEAIAANAAKGLVNKVSAAKLLQGDLAEAWREADAEYASVAMRFSILDMTVERASGRIVDGDPARPQEVTEIWTLRRARGGDWQLSAIQQRGRQ